MINTYKLQSWQKLCNNGSWFRVYCIILKKNSRLECKNHALFLTKTAIHSIQVAHQARAYPGFCSMKWLIVFLLPPGWDASPSQGLPPSIKFVSAHLYAWVERGTAVRVKCLAQEHNAMSLARTWTQTAWSGDELTNHEATAPPTP